MSDRACSNCGDKAAAKGRCRTCYRYWLRSGRRRDRDMAVIYDRRDERMVMAQEFRQMAYEVREGLTLA